MHPNRFRYPNDGHEAKCFKVDFDWRDMFRFHFRVQKYIPDYIRSLQGRPFSVLCNQAIYWFGLAIKEGRINTQSVSRFRNREDVRDKVECIVALEIEAKDFIEKYAFAMRVSQAEVMRMALEWFIEVELDTENRGVRAVALWKWHHKVGGLHIESFAFSFWRFGRELMWTVTSPSEPFPLRC